MDFACLIKCWYCYKHYIVFSFFFVCVVIFFLSEKFCMGLYFYRDYNFWMFVHGNSISKREQDLISASQKNGSIALCHEFLHSVEGYVLMVDLETLGQQLDSVILSILNCSMILQASYLKLQHRWQIWIFLGRPAFTYSHVFTFLLL